MSPSTRIELLETIELLGEAKLVCIKLYRIDDKWLFSLACYVDDGRTMSQLRWARSEGHDIRPTKFEVRFINAPHEKVHTFKSEKAAKTNMVVQALAYDCVNSKGG